MAAPEEPLRRRKAAGSGREPGSPLGPERSPTGSKARLRAGTFWLTRIVLLRSLAFVYCESAGPGPRRYRSSARARSDLPRLVPWPLLWRVNSQAPSHAPPPHHGTCTPPRSPLSFGPESWLRSGVRALAGVFAPGSPLLSVARLDSPSPSRRNPESGTPVEQGGTGAPRRGHRECGN